MENIKDLRERTLGIDFGTTNTVVSYFDQDKIVCFQITGTSFLIKSIIAYYEKDKLLIGYAADKNKNLKFRVKNVKYLLGKNEEDCEEFKDIAFGASLEFHDMEPILVSDTGSGMRMTPVEVVTCFLKELKQKVEEKTNRHFSCAVLTAPTTFRTKQKGALKKAAANAGLEVKMMLSEPTAAGLHYQLTSNMKSKGVYLVFDFGGGTLDLSLVYCKDNVYYTLASAGDHHLGGNDIDVLCMNMVEDHYRRENNEPLFGNQTKSTLRRRERLLKEVEEAKIQLAEMKAVTVLFEDDAGETQEYTITLAEFENRLESVMEQISNCLTDLAKQFVNKYDGETVNGFYVSKEDSKMGTLETIVDSVILVGGSSKLKAVQKRLKQYFKDRVYIDPDTQLCVSKGVMESMFMISDPLKGVREVLFHTLVVKVDGKAIGRVSRGTTIPFGTQYGTRQRRGSAMLQVAIYEVNEEQEEKTETLLVSREVACERSYTQVQPFLLVRVEVNLDGMMTVSMRDPLTGKDETVGTADLWCVC